MLGTSLRLIAASAVIAGASAVLQAMSPQQAPAPRASGVTAEHRAVLDTYCVTCHNERLKTAGVTLEGMNLADLANDAHTWEAVVRKLRSATMPPAGRPRPDQATYNSLATYLETGLDRAAAIKPNPGRRPALHRLNRAEYRNAIRDLLALEVDVTSLLPPDDASYGFDNIANGAVSPTLLERYVTAARKISRLAIASPRVPLEVSTYSLPIDLTQNDQLEGLPLGTRGGLFVRHHFPRDGEYEFRLAVNRPPPMKGMTVPHQIEVSVDGERVQLLTVGENTGQDLPRQLGGRDADDGLHVRASVKAGLRSVGVTFLKRPSVEVEGLRQPFLSDQARVLPPLEVVEIRGPYGATGAEDTPTRRRIFECRPANVADEARCARQILSSLARRGYRRPVTGTEVRDLLSFYDAGRRSGDFEAGLEMALRRMLVSPSFLFRVERDPAGVAPNAAYRVGDFELASRLSFFLWSSSPDEQLLDLAERGRLRDPAVLTAQVRRMLADARSEALTSNFAGQWLYLRNVPNAKPDPPLFPDFDENLRQALRRETELFFESILRENRSVVELLTANYTFLNERLARHYGIPNVYGSHFRRVALDAGSVRGGLLGQGSILTVTSHTNRTSPVQRGKWILENVLGAPPPPPPADVPDLKDTNSQGKVLSMRERMVQHRANPACSSCHARMDPLGLSLENFDAVGQWRTRGESNELIDASGALPSGRAFEGAAGLREALLNHSEDFVRTLTEKLLTYALGRGLEYYDAPAVRKIVRDAAPTKYGLSSLIVGIVNSAPFQMRNSAPGSAQARSGRPSTRSAS